MKLRNIRVLQPILGLLLGLILLGFVGLATAYTLNNPAGTTYYVSVNGNDNNAGTSAFVPWRSLDKINSFDFQPGDTIRFERNGVWKGELEIQQSGTQEALITYSDYGEGELPVITSPGSWHIVYLNADWIVIQNLKLEDAYEAGVRLTIEAEHNLVRNLEITNVGHGASIAGQYNLVTGNYIHDLKMVVNTPDEFDDDYGAVGIVIFNSNNEISYNRLINCLASCYDYGINGGAIEWFTSQPIEATYVHHNYAENNDGFFEIGGPDQSPLTKTRLAYNVGVNNRLVGVFHTGGNWMIPVTDFQLENNTFIETNGGWQILSFWPDDPLDGAVSLKNNIFVINNYSVFTTATNLKHSHNLYYLTNTPLGFDLDETELVADPLLVDMNQKDFHLQTDSPAINAGIDLGYSQDFDNNPLVGAVDLGAYEYQGAVLPSPTPTPVPVNQAPQLITKRLPGARINRYYETQVIAYDYDLDDKLTMSATGLPAGLDWGECSDKINKQRQYKEFRCTLGGEMTERASYQVQVIVKDKYDAIASRLYTLKVR